MFLYPDFLAIFCFLFDTIIRFVEIFLVQKFVSALIEWFFFFLPSLNGSKNQRTSLLRTIYFFFFYFYIFFIRIVRARFSPGGFVNKSRTRWIILRENLKRLSRHKVFEHRLRISHFFQEGRKKGTRNCECNLFYCAPLTWSPFFVSQIFVDSILSAFTS